MFLRKNVDFGVYHDVLKKPKHHETVHLTMLIAHPYHPLKQKWCNILAEFSLTFTDWQSQVNAREKSYWPFDQLMHISSHGDNLCSKLLSFPIQSNGLLDINNNNPSFKRKVLRILSKQKPNHGTGRQACSSQILRRVWRPLESGCGKSNGQIECLPGPQLPMWCICSPPVYMKTSLEISLCGIRY